ncbi:MAG: ATP-binding protein, partial [Proteobacteria bacterium]|nr:ATP-binding protein [Pseudomonadota bacterium]
ASTHLLSLINDVLDLSKIEAGRLVLERADFSVREILDQVCTLVDESARAKGLSVTMEWEDGPLWLLGDPTRVRQALLNLAANAVKFTSAGGLRLIARRLPDPGPEILMRFEVQDSGIGIDAGMLRELFRPFVQGDDSTTRKYGGTGLGLAITKQLVNLMGGEVVVESQPGIGSRFWFSVRFAPGRAVLPAAAAASIVSAAVTSTATAAAADMAEATLRRSHGGARLLLVDDDMINQEVVLVILEDSGLKVDRADDGAQALAMAAATHYDLILMDMQMPVLDGLAATEAIRRLPAHAQTPILAMTANVFEDDRQRCLAAGMNEHLAKPVVPQVLYEALLRWLPGHAAASTVATESAAPAPVDCGQAHTALQHVAALLAADDPRAEQALREHLPLLRACLDAEILFLLERQVQAFDYPQALQTARAAQQTLGRGSAS